MSDSRERFEEWAASPPFEYDLSRWPNDDTRFAWPGQYRRIEVQFAWEAWSARDSEVERLREALQRLCKSFPTDSDMAEAGWEGPEIDEACAAYDAARALLSSQDKESA